MRFHALDALRATAMFLGIVLHACASFAVALPVPWIVRDVSAHVSFNVVLAAIHGFRMPLFFFIAGFFAHLLWKRLGTREFVAQRARRIGVPFLLGMATLLPICVAIVFWAMQRGGAPLPPPTRGPPTMHLWFLEMLLVLYALAMAVAWASRFLDAERWSAVIDRAFGALWRSRFKALTLAAVTMIPLWFGPGWGEVDHMGVSAFLAPRAIAYFGLFFAVGWWLHRRVELLDALRRPLGGAFTIAFFAFVAWIVCVGIWQRAGQPAAPLKAAALAFAALYTWTMTFALTGLFLRIASTERPWARYLADSSYWCYLAHVPVVFVLQVLAARVEMNGWLKAGLIILATTAILLASYELLVRYTWFGRLLNGPRSRAKPPQPPLGDVTATS